MRNTQGVGFPEYLTQKGVYEEEEGIAEQFIQFYSNLFGSQNSQRKPINPEVLEGGKRITEEQRIMLCSQVSDEEVHRAVFSIDQDKAPGPDGFGSGFFRASWNTVKGDICRAVKDFFRTGKILKQINNTLISLVPKTPCPNLVTEYRPIACCNVLYKIIAKIIATRLSSVLPEIISENQGGFVQGRSIMENILICQELARNYHREGGTARCMIKLDIQKAYDSLEWGFLEQVMLGLNFPEGFVEKIMMCLSTVSFSFLINGGSHGFIKGRRGLRQGDPMSPLLFVIGMEYLSRALGEMGKQKEFGFHSRNKGLRLNHLCFADDLMIFCKANVQSTKLIKDVIDDFGRVSGLCINKAKSHIFLAGVEEQGKEAILQLTEYVEGKLPMRYLGLPLISTRLKDSDCKPIIDSIKKKLTKWSSRVLSYAGRLQLINSVLFHTQTYWSSIVYLPASVMKTIEALCRNFLWHGNEEGRKLNAVAWQDVCLPRSEGGLGVIQLRAWNKAALGKHLWTILTKLASLWSKWMHSNYIKGKSLWQLQIPNDCS